MKEIFIPQPWKFKAAGKPVCWKFVFIMGSLRLCTVFPFHCDQSVPQKQDQLYFVPVGGICKATTQGPKLLVSCVLLIQPPANTHPPCEHNTGMKLCPAEQVLTDFCSNDVLWAWLSCWHLLTTQDACILLQQLCFSFWICANRKAPGGRVYFSSYWFFQDAAWLRSVPRTEAVEQRNFYRLIRSMTITALATSHAVARICTNQNETTRNRRAEQHMQGPASDSSFSTSADTSSTVLWHGPAYVLEEKNLSTAVYPGK